MPHYECLEQIISVLSNAPNYLKIMAMRQVKELGHNPQVLEILAELLADPSWRIRRNAAEALGDCGPAALGYLELIFKQTEDEENFLDPTAGAIAAAKIDPDHPKTTKLIRQLIIIGEKYGAQAAISLLPNPAPSLKRWFACVVRGHLKRYHEFEKALEGWRYYGNIHMERLGQMVPECRAEIQTLREMMNSTWDEQAGQELLESVIQTWQAR